MAKLPPFLPRRDAFDPAFSLVAEDIAALESLGSNAVRLLVSWPGVEPARGSYNDTYLDELEAIVNDLGAAGMHTLLDFHQDVYSPFFCGNGFPDWATHVAGYKPLPNASEDQYGAAPFPKPVRGEALPRDAHTGYVPHKACAATAPFPEYYLAEATGVAFQALYDNVGGIRASLASFWARVAARFSGNPHVLGYDLINEPWSGDIYRKPVKLEGSKVDREVLLPLYDELSAAIRAHDNDSLIFFEPAVITSAIPLRRLAEEVGFDRPPQSSEGKAVLSYHTYCPLGGIVGEIAGEMVCSEFFDDVFGNHLPTAMETAGVPAFLTEFGAVVTGEGFDAWTLNEVARRADDLFLSATYWAFKELGDPTTQSEDKQGVPHEGIWNTTTGELDAGKAALLARTYAAAVAGKDITLHTYDPQTKEFALVYTHTKELATEATPTEIRWSTYVCPDGVSAHAVPSAATRVDAKSIPGTVLVWLNASEDTQVMVTVRRREGGERGRAPGVADGRGGASAADGGRRLDPPWSALDRPGSSGVRDVAAV